MFLLRHAVSRSIVTPRLKTYPSLHITPTYVVTQTRSYASKNKKDNKKDKNSASSSHLEVEDFDHKYNKDFNKHSTTTSNLVPRSQQILAGEDYVKAEDKMKSILERFRREVSGYETRASGRVTTALLAPVRVVLPGHGEEGKGVRLEEIATVGVKEGATLLVTVFDEHSLKHVEEAIYNAKLPGITPQRVDSRTIKIPVPKPTVEARLALYTSAQRHAEDSRVHIRKQHQASLKKGAYKKHAPEIDEFQKLTDKYITDVDKILTEFKKLTGAK